MSKKKHIFFSSILTLGISATLLFSATTNNTREVLALEETYYSSITASGGKQLLGQLHDLITKTHTTYTSYSDCSNSTKVESTDAYYEGGVAKDGYITDFYSGVKLVSTWDGGKTWNREHVWCQSNTRSDPKDDSTKLWGESGGGSDLHHIRPTDPTANSTRNNHRYGEVSSGKACYGKNGALNGYYETDCFEPLENKKGDCARILFYLYTHYNSYSNSIFSKNATTNGSGSSSYFGSLSFIQNVNASSEDKAIELLLSWNKSDPVDILEINRNEAVYKIQGNRNPFIDNSDYADAIWGKGTIPSTVPVTGISLNKSSTTIEAGKTETLIATVVPANATYKGVNWTSSNTGVATVTNGVVSAISEGQTTITATTQDGSFSKNCSVTVTPAPVVEQPPVDDSLIFDRLTRAETTATTTIYVEWSGVKLTSDAVYAGQSAGGNESIQLRSNNNNSGIITTTSGGNIRQIIAEFHSATASGRTVNVYGSNTAFTSPTQLYSSSADIVLLGTLTSSTTTLDISGNYKYVGVRSAAGALYLSSISFGWEGSGSSGGTVEPTYSISLDKSSISLEIGQTETLNATCSPENDGTLTWSSSETSVATVDNGVVTAVGEGETTITALYHNEEATCSVSVSPRSSGSEDDEEEEEIITSGIFSKVTSTNDIAEGKYLIVCESSSVIFNGGLASLDSSSNNVSVTISNSKIEYTESLNNATFTINPTAKTIKSNSGYYIGAASDSNSLNSSTSNAYTNTMSIDQNGDFVCKGSGGAYLRYNANAGNLRFRYYRSETYTSQKAIQLYKLVDVNVQAVENFINSYMHPEISSSDKGTGACLNYYEDAKNAFFNVLNKTQRNLLAANYTEYFTRLQHWAIANGENIELMGDDYVLNEYNRLSIFKDSLDGDHSVILISSLIVIIGISLAVCVLKKRKTN